MTTFTEFIQNISTHIKSVPSSNKIAPFYDAAKSYKGEDLRTHVTTALSPTPAAVAGLEYYNGIERSHLMKQMRPRHYYALYKNSVDGRVSDLTEMVEAIRRAPIDVGGFA